MGKPTIKRSEIRDVTFGENVIVVEPSNLYECKIGDNSFIGPFVEIQKGVSIGSNCKVQSHTFICELVTIGNDCFIGHGIMFINDLMQNGPSGGDKSKWKRTSIGSKVSIGSNATILPVNICDNVVIGAVQLLQKTSMSPELMGEILQKKLNSDYLRFFMVY